MTTTAILCIARNELAFTAEWLEYHFALGIDRVYYVSTDDDYGRVHDFFERSPFRSRVELRHFEDFEPGWQIECYNAHFPFTAEDWLLVLDLDEFLHLHPFSSIGEYLATIPAGVGQVQFPWLLATSEAYQHDRALDVAGRVVKRVSNHVKSMVRRRDASELGVHSHGVPGRETRLSSGAEVDAAPWHAPLLDDPGYFERHPYVLHVVSRGHLDALARVADQRFFNAKCGRGERERLARYLRGPAAWEDLPNRYLLTKFYESLPAADVKCSLPVVDAVTDLGELERVFRAAMEGIVDLQDEGPGDMAREFERRHRFAEKLASQDLGTLPDVDAYLACTDQLEYVAQLRRALNAV